MFPEGGGSTITTLLVAGDLVHHPRRHVKEKMAVEGPFAGLSAVIRMEYLRPGGTLTMYLLGRRLAGAPFSSHTNMPCRSTDCVIIVSLTKVSFTRSPYLSSMGVASPDFLPLSVQMLHVAREMDGDFARGCPLVLLRRQ